jgi:two-component sensor histidine kinase
MVIHVISSRLAGETAPEPGCAQADSDLTYLVARLPRVMRSYPQAGCSVPARGGLRIKRILRSRLPERFAGRLPPWTVEVAIGIVIPVLVTMLRLGLTPWTADRAPYSLAFVSVVGATVLAGWRSGLLALVLGQLLAWFVIVDPASYAAQRGPYVGGLAVATLSQLAILVIITLYQREVERAWSRQVSQVDLLNRALAEIDHRTVNNYQAVQSLILAQANGTADGIAKDALHKIADRITAIANASRRLAASSDNLEQVRPAEHLQELCAQIERGLSRRGVTVVCDFADVSLSSEETTAVSMLVNELVTNALKHAFPEERDGVIQVSLGPAPGGLVLLIEDNGIGFKPGARSRSTGLGTRLVKTFVLQLKATHRVDSGEGGTRHHIHIPAKA